MRRTRLLYVVHPGENEGLKSIEGAKWGLQKLKLSGKKCILWKVQ